MKRVLILGSTGMLGHICTQYMSKHFDVIATYSTQPVYRTKNVIYVPFKLNSLIDLQQLRGIIAEFNPDYIINCLGVIKQRSVLDFEKMAMLVNVALPHYIFRIFKGINFIHITTDCAYDGKVGEYIQNDIPSALDVYGMSKYLGQSQGGNTLNIRLSIIGPQLSGHLGLMDFLLLKEQQIVNGYTSHIWNGVTTLQFAEWITDTIKNRKFFSGSRNLVLHKDISKYELLLIIRDIFGVHKIINPVETQIVNRTLRSYHYTNCIEYKDSLQKLKSYMSQNADIYGETYGKYI